MGNRRSMENNRRMERRRGTEKRISPKERQKKKRKRRRKRIILVCVELFVLAGLCIAGYGMLKLGKLNINILDQNKLEVYKDTGPYTNIACFGLDSRNGELEGGVQSDSIMIVSINNETNDVKLISVYRDTLLQQADGSYSKANSASVIGGIRSEERRVGKEC